MTESTQRPALAWWRGRRLDAVLALLVAILSFAYVADAVGEHDQLSPIDEYVYADYLYKFPDQGVVKHGEETGAEARDLIACRGVATYGMFGSNCGASTHDEDALYPYAGGTAADIYTPLYFGATWVAAATASQATGDDLFDSGRVAGGLWLAAGAVALLGLMRRLAVDRWLALGLTLLTVSTPAVFWANTYVSTDAPAVLAGASLGYVALRVARRDLRAAWLIAVAPVAVLVKVQFLAGVVFAAVFLLIVAGAKVRWERLGDGLRATLRDPRARAGIAAVGAAMAAQVVWMLVRMQWDEGTPADQGIHGRPELAGVLGEAFRFVGGAVTGPVAMGTARDTIGVLVSWLCIAGVIGVTLAGRVHASPVREAKAADVASPAVVDTAVEGRAWASAALFTGMVAGPALALAAAFIGGASFGLPARYGLVLVPTFVASFALLVPRHRAFGYAVTAVGVLAVVVSFTQDYLA